MPILLNNMQQKMAISDAQLHQIEAVVLQGMESHGHETAEVSLVLTDDDYIAELNLEYRGIDASTDVLSFALDEMEEGPALPDDAPHLLGDIYISVDKAAEQAESYGHSLERELCYLAVHGLLHLSGFDHDTEEATAAMRSEEEKILNRFSLGRA